MPQSTHHGLHNGLLLATLVAAALLALVTAWTAALARVPQQRAAVERLLRAQTGLDVRYARLVVRLGFYGPEAEFSDIEMRLPGAATPLLRAPRMVARFESWRLLRGGQLRPGRMLVSGAEIDLRQLATLRREPRPAAALAVPAGGPAGRPADTPLEAFESRLPALLAAIPEGSLDFEAVTLLWASPARPAELLQLRAPRLYASRRIDGAQLSGTVLLPSRLGRTLFVTAQLREGGRVGGAGLHGRLRASGRGLVLSSWRELGLLPPTLIAGTGDVSVAVQLRAGRVQQAEGSARLAGLAVATPAPLQARRFGLATGEFTFSRTTTALRYRLHQLEMVPAGAAASAAGERGALEFDIDPRDGSGSLSMRRVPVEAAALLVAAVGDGVAVAMPALRLLGGEVRSLDGRWGAAHRTDPLVLRGTVAGLAVASIDGAWRVDGMGATLRAEGPRLQVRLEGRELPLRAPWFAGVAEPVRADVAGRVDVALAAGGWSAAVGETTVEVARGPRLRLAGAAGAVGDGPVAGQLSLSLAAPLVRADMTLLQALLRRWAPDAFWQAFRDGRLESATAELGSEGLRAASFQLRGATLAAAAGRPETTALDADLDWDGGRLEGRLLSGRVGPLALAGGRVSMPVPRRVGGSGGLTVEARLSGTLEDALRLAAVGELPGGVPLELAGEARIDALLRLPATAPGARPLELAIDVADARWQPVAGAAPLTGLGGRLRADDRGLRDGRLEGRWLGGPVLLRLAGGQAAELQLVANGRLPVAALEREWAWIDLVDRAIDGSLEWSAELRRDTDAARGVEATRARREGARRPVAPPAPALDEAAMAWRLRVELPGGARADLRWMPGADAQAPWRIDRGTVVLGDGPAIAGIPGALVVGGRLERLELIGLAGAIAQFGASAGWQRPLVGEVAVADLRLGDGALGGARLRLAGSRESTTVDLLGESIAGELRQVHAEPGRLRGNFARLRLAEEAGPGALAEAMLGMRTSLALQVADLQRGRRSLGALAATFDADGTSVATRDLALRRGSRRASASGRCERATLVCSAEFGLAGADLGELLQDLGRRPELPGRDAALTARLGWSMQPGARFAESVQGELAFGASLDVAFDPDAAMRAFDAGVAGGGAAVADGVGSADALPGSVPAPSWSLLAPLLAVVKRQSADLQASGQPAAAQPARSPAPTLPFERLELRLSIRDGVAQIDRYDAIGRAARLSVEGSFDFRRGTLEQQAHWYWIAPGVAGAVERLDPRSSLAATLRTLRDLLAARDVPSAAATRGGAPVSAAERFALSGPATMPMVERLPLLDSPR